MPEPDLKTVVTPIDFPSKDEFVLFHLSSGIPVWINMTRVQYWYVDPNSDTTIMVLEQNNRVYIKEKISL